MAKKILTEQEQTLQDSNPKLKVSMLAALLFIQENGNMSKDNLDLFVTTYCIGGSTGTSTGPREVTILRDDTGVQLGRMCSATKLWFDNTHFSKNTTVTKLVDKAKVVLYTASKKAEVAAKTLLVEAKEIEDTMDKVAKYEEYDAALVAAQELRANFVVTDEMLEGGLDSIEALAEALDVEVNPEVIVEEESTEVE